MSKRKFWRRRVHDLLSSLDAPRPCDHIVCGGGATSPPFNSLSPSFQIHSSILGEYNTTMTITTDNADLETDLGGGLGGDSVPSPSAPHASSASSSNPSMVMEQSTNSDGSLSVKVTTTTSQPYGYQNVNIEHYHIPSSMVNTVRTSLDVTGEPPSSLYLTSIENTSSPDGKMPPGMMCVICYFISVLTILLVVSIVVRFLH